MDLHCFSNLSDTPIRVIFFREQRVDEYYLYNEVDVIRAKYANKYDILSVVVSDNFIHLTIYQPNDFSM